MSESAEARKRRENPVIKKNRDRQKKLRSMKRKDSKKKSKSKSKQVDLHTFDGMSVDEALEAVKE